MLEVIRGNCEAIIAGYYQNLPSRAGMHLSVLVGQGVRSFSTDAALPYRGDADSGCSAITSWRG
ncbi:hypothetical protein SAMN03097708_00012 [Thiohalomonas denitrificans]|uniref:Uncharacterized protein n=1 Tax=Thiohalomonas denitrificans TaxID=415747 RepID=A0A1G5PHY4_9GAMM|nr:hypothetical protein SAMN03097708_00012 [Thiohalomonas denitrificans]